MGSHFLTLQKNLVLRCCCFAFACDARMTNAVFQAVARAKHAFQLAVSAHSLASCIQRSCLGRQLTPLVLLIMSHGITLIHPISPLYLGSQSKEEKTLSSQEEGPSLISCLFICQATACDNPLQTHTHLKPASKSSSQSSRGKPT